MQGARDTKVVAGRIPRKLAIRLEAVTNRNRDPLAPTVGRIVALGVELALRELEQKRK